MSQPDSPDRLDSWKDIATYLRRAVRTVIRWEQEEGLPVHRHQHDKRGSVYAYKSELDDWLQNRALRPEAAEAPSETGLGTSRWRAIILTVAVATVLAIAVIWGFVLRRSEAPTPVTVPLTTYPGIEVNPTFSPDGTRIAFAWNKDAGFDIYEKQLGSDAPPLRLTNTPAPYAAPAWSPDGLHIAFLRGMSGNRYGIFVVPGLGGAERKLAEIQAIVPWPSISWTPDSHWIITTHQLPNIAEPLRLFLVSADTGEMHQFTNPPAGSRGDFAGILSSDGRTLAVSFLRNGLAREIHVVPVSSDWKESGVRTVVDRTQAGASRVMWTPNGDLLYSKFLNGTDILRRASRHSRWAAVPVPGVGQIGSGIFAVSPRGDKLAFSDYRNGPSLWRLDLSDAHSIPKLFVSSTGHEQNPAISPDGKRVAFVSWRLGPGAIWVANSDGSEERQLTFLHGAGLPSFSLDGNEIAFDVSVDGNMDFYVVPVSGGAPRRMTAGPGEDILPSWSFNGKWMYFCSTRAGAGYQIWKMPASGEGSAVQITRHGGLVARESVDGRFIYYGKQRNAAGNLNAPGVWRVPTSGGDEELVIPSVNNPRNFAVFADGIYFARPHPDGFELCFYRFATRQSEPRAVVHKSGGEGLAISPDGRWALFSALDTQGGDLWLIENFR